MKNSLILTCFFTLFSIYTFSQEDTSNIKVGDVFVIGEVANNNYQHIHFPRANRIIKKGGIVANYKNIKGKKVEVTSIKNGKDGRLLATIKLASNKYFFNSHKFVTVEIKEAINKKELLNM